MYKCGSLKALALKYISNLPLPYYTIKQCIKEIFSQMISHRFNHKKLEQLNEIESGLVSLFMNSAPTEIEHQVGSYTSVLKQLTTQSKPM